MEGEGAYSEVITDLMPDTEYKYYAKAKNSYCGVDVGETLTFTTAHGAPVVTTDAPTDITTDSVTMNGNVVNTGGPASVQARFVWGTVSGGPYTNSSSWMDVGGVGSQSYGASGLAGGQRYYYRIEAKNELGTSNGEERDFRCGSVPATIVTEAATEIRPTSAVLNGSMLDKGSSPVGPYIAFEWGLHSGVYTNKARVGTGTMSFPGSFHLTITTKPGTTYYYHALGESTHGMAMGQELSFTTPTCPEIETLSATSVGYNSAVINAAVSSFGSSGTVHVEFVWGPLENPTRYTTGAVTLTEPGDASVTLNNLASDTRYFYRAVVQGDSVSLTDTGEMDSFTTLLSPTVSTRDADYVVTDSVLLKGELLTRGSSDLVDVWFEWGTVSGTYTDSTPPSVMNGPGAFDFLLTGLEPGHGYYFRAASGGTAAGTTYGEEKFFITTTIAPGIRTLTPVWTGDTTIVFHGELVSMGTADRVDVGFEGGGEPGAGTFGLIPYTLTAPGAFSLEATDMQMDAPFYVRAMGYGGVSGVAVGNEIRTISCSGQTFGGDCTPCPDCDHGTCDAGSEGTGMCVCETGWTGATCREGLCDPECVHGGCVEPNVCSCETGWGGAICDTAICQPECGTNASCTAPGTCTCDSGYHGDGYTCEQDTECTGADDWTECPGGACFSERCEPLAVNDRCDDAIVLEPGTEYSGNFYGCHSLATVPSSCGGEEIAGPDAFFSVYLENSDVYEVILVPSSSADVAMAIWPDCDLDASDCIQSMNASGAGGTETLTIDVETAAGYVIQVVLMNGALSAGESGFTIQVRSDSAQADPDPVWDAVVSDGVSGDNAHVEIQDSENEESVAPRDTHVADSHDDSGGGGGGGGGGCGMAPATGNGLWLFVLMIAGLVAARRIRKRLF